MITNFEINTTNIYFQHVIDGIEHIPTNSIIKFTVNGTSFEILCREWRSQLYFVRKNISSSQVKSLQGGDLVNTQKWVERLKEAYNELGRLKLQNLTREVGISGTLATIKSVHEVFKHKEINIILIYPGMNPGESFSINLNNDFLILYNNKSEEHLKFTYCDDALTSIKNAVGLEVNYFECKEDPALRALLHYSLSEKLSSEK